MAAIGLGSLLGSVALLRLSNRPNKGEPLLVGFVVSGAASPASALRRTRGCRLHWPSWAALPVSSLSGCRPWSCRR